MKEAIPSHLMDEFTSGMDAANLDALPLRGWLEALDHVAGSFIREHSLPGYKTAAVLQYLRWAAQQRRLKT